MKAIASGPSLLVHWARVDVGSTERLPGAGDLELAVEDYATDAQTVPAAYVDLAGLVQKLEDAFRPASTHASVQGAATEGEVEAPAAHTGSRGGGQGDGDEMAHEWQEPGPRFAGGVGCDDVVPPGVRPPGYGHGGARVEGGNPALTVAGAAPRAWRERVCGGLWWWGERERGGGRGGRDGWDSSGAEDGCGVWG